MSNFYMPAVRSATVVTRTVGTRYGAAWSRECVLGEVQ